MPLSSMKILSFVDHDFEDLELWYPILRLREEGITVHLAGEKANTEYVGKYGVKAISDFSWDTVNSSEYDGLLVPGGWAPDRMRRFEKVLQIVREMNEKGKPIAQICHAGWVLISAKILQGRIVTSTPGIKDDMINAGATWLDQAVVVDKNIVSARRPPDLPPYMKAFVELLKQ